MTKPVFQHPVGLTIAARGPAAQMIEAKTALNLRRDKPPRPPRGLEAALDRGREETLGRVERLPPQPSWGGA